MSKKSVLRVNFSLFWHLSTESGRCRVKKFLCHISVHSLSYDETAVANAAKLKLNGREFTKCVIFFIVRGISMYLAERDSSHVVDCLS